MDKIKLAFLAFHPGSANTLTALVNYCKEHPEKYEVLLYPFLPYAQKAWGEDTLYEDGMHFFDTFPTDIDVVFYCAAANSIVEDHLPIFCKEHDILTISTVDIFWLDEANIIKRFPTLPDIIITPEKRVQQMIEKLNWDVTVLNLGNPYFSVLQQKPRVIDNAKKKLAVISAPATNEILTHTHPVPLKILDSICQVMQHDHTIEKVYICPHPREEPSLILQLLSKYPELQGRIEFNSFGNTNDCCEVVDVVVGWKSTVLYEEYLRGKAVHFYRSQRHFRLAMADANKLYENVIDLELPENALSNYVKLLDVLF